MIVLVVAATPIVAWFTYDRVNSRVLHLVGTDYSGRYLIYTEEKPCMEEGCFYVFRFKGSDLPTKWIDYSCAKVGGEPCTLRVNPKFESYESIIFKKDVPVIGKSMAFTFETNFFTNQKMHKEGDHLIVRVGNSKREDTIKFKPQF